MGKIWMVLMLASAGVSLICGRGAMTSEALLTSGKQAVELMLTLVGTMTLWSGLMEILVESGDVQRMGKLFRKILRPLFPGLHDDKAWNAISMNLSANLLGLGNAATPAGIEAAKRLSGLGTAGMSALATLLVLDNTSLQLIPTTVITLRQAAGAANPGDVWGMTLVISGAATVIAVVLIHIVRSRRQGI
ncbi:MAG: hypothetical protein E7318_00855 [Clostridiales bacterium]|nr:hypothetical protein [Clostridiales bacterium]